jgi:hypothetical protein
LTIELNQLTRNAGFTAPIAYSELRFPITTIVRRVSCFRNFVAYEYCASDEVNVYLDFSPDSVTLSLSGANLEAECDMELFYEHVHGLLFNDVDKGVFYRIINVLAHSFYDG